MIIVLHLLINNQDRVTGFYWSSECDSFLACPQSPIQSCRSLQALYLCKRLKSSPKTHDHVTIFDVDIQKLAFDSPSTRCSCYNLKQLYLMLTFYRMNK
jgi:hypothetical protein